MTTGKKSIIIFLAIAAACLLLFSTLAPLISQNRIIKKKVTRELSRILNADVELEGLSLDAFGAPCITLQGLLCTADAGISVDVKKIIVYPDLKALFFGDLQMKRIIVESPVVNILLQKNKEMQTGVAHAPVFADIRQQAAESLAAVMRSMASGSCVIEQGMVRLHAPDGAQLDFRSINARVTTAQNSIALFSECASTLWEKLELKADCGFPGSGSIAKSLTIGVSITSVNVRECKNMAPAFAAQLPSFGKICERIREGRIPALALTAHIPLPCDENWSRYISLQGNAEAMTLSIPEIGFDVHALSGALNVSGGMVEVKDLNARIGNSRISDGILRLDSADQFKPVLIKAGISADLAELPGFLHLIPSPGLRAELGLIKNPSGTAGGIVTVQRHGNFYSTEVAINELTLNARYRSFPAPLFLERGTVTCSGGILAFKDFSGRLGASVLPEISVSFGIMDDDRFSASARGATVVFDDLYAILSSFDETKTFIAPVTKAAGSALIQDIAVNGPLSSPVAWAFSLRGSVSSASFSISGVDGPVAIKSGSINLDQNRIALSSLNIRFFDAALSGSLILDGYRGGLQITAGEAAGSLGKKSIAQAAEYLNVPRDLLLRTPLSVKKAKFARQQGGAATFTGELVFPEDTRASIDVKTQPGNFEMRSLKIQDARSQCTGSLGIRDDLFTVAYRGTLDKTTLDRVFADNRLVQVWIKGDFTAVFNEKTPLESFATGTVSWKNAGYTGFKLLPLTINSASVTAHGRDIVIDAAHITAGKSSAGIAGSVRFDENGFNLDIDMSSDSIDLDTDGGLFSGDNKTVESPHEEFWDTPLRGIVRLKAEEFKKDGITWSPFHADIAFSDRKITAAATDIKLCSIALPGSMQITPEIITLEAHPEAKGIHAKNVIQCLTGEKSIITGTLDIKSDLAGQGKPSDIIDSLTGKVTITARKGHIYKSTLLTKIVSFLSIRNLLFGGARDFAKKGFAYRSIEIHGEVRGDTFIVHDAVLNSNSLTIVSQGKINLKNKSLELTALATPFQIQDLVLMAVPVVGVIFSKTLIGVPIRISGNLEDAKLSPGSPAAIGKGIAAIVKNVVKLPVQIIEPVLMLENNKENKQAP